MHIRPHPTSGPLHRCLDTLAPWGEVLLVAETNYLEIVVSYTVDDDDPKYDGYIYNVKYTLIVDFRDMFSPPMYISFED